MTKLSQGLSGHLKGFLRDWSLPRQIAGQSVKSKAAESETSRQLRPRLEQADRVGTSVCPFCAVGCAQLIYSKNGRPIHIEGDPRSPVNQGTLCPKGAGTLGMLLSPQRITNVLYRAPYSDHWEKKPLEWAMDRIAHLTMEAREEGFREEADGYRINNVVNMFSLGGATMDNEENYLIKKLLGGGLGIVPIENQARI